MNALAALVVTVALCFAVEAPWGQPGTRRDRAPAALAARAAVYALLMLFWFQFSWRPWLAGVTALGTVVVMAVVSRLKRRIIGEPVVFSDFALLKQVVRHPQLYYVTPLRVIGGLAAFTAAGATWYTLERPLTPASWWAALACVVAVPCLLYGLVQASSLPPVRARLARAAPVPDLLSDEARWGLLLTLAVYALRWRQELIDRETADRGRAGAAPAAARPAAGPVVVVQLESFLDPVRLGGAPLPAFERLKARALMHGRLSVPAHGAYTMRSEFAVLTGQDEAEIGFGRYDPYLSTVADVPGSLPRAAAARGLEPVFVHPFHDTFFGRDVVMPRLGFTRSVMEDAFADAARHGPYVSDAALVQRILAEARGEGGRPAFVFSVTMENHGPWGAGRLPGLDRPLAQYLDHVANTGRAVDALVAGLEPGPALLCVYGDHPPSLPECTPGFEGTRTDYAILALGDPTPGRRVDLSAAELGRVLRELVAGERPALLDAAA